MNKLALLLLAAAPFALVSCGGDAVGPSDVQGDWRLVSLTRPDQSTLVIPDPTRFTARFEDGGRLSLRADCNVCNGSYAFEGDALVSSALACTRAFCGSAPVDTQYVGILEGRSTTRASEDRLTVSSDRGRLVFER